jgi:hypothetical protein
MKAKLLVSTAILTAICSFNTFADNTIPDKCPSVKAITAAGLASMHKYSSQKEQGWYGQQQSTYDTDQEWSFFVGLFDFNATENDARNSAVASLSTLHKVFGPIVKDENTNSYMCIYSDMIKDTKVSGFAITPPQNLNLPSDLRARFAK